MRATLILCVGYRAYVCGAPQIDCAPPGGLLGSGSSFAERIPGIAASGRFRTDSSASANRRSDPGIRAGRGGGNPQGRLPGGVKAAKGGHGQIDLGGSDSIFGSFAALGDAIALNSAVVLVPGV